MSVLIIEGGELDNPGTVHRINGWAVAQYQGLIELRYTCRNENQNTYAQVLITITKDGVMFSTNGKAWFGSNGFKDLSDVITYVQEELL